MLQPSGNPFKCHMKSFCPKFPPQRSSFPLDQWVYAQIVQMRSDFSLDAFRFFLKQPRIQTQQLQIYEVLGKMYRYRTALPVQSSTQEAHVLPLPTRHTFPLRIVAKGRCNAQLARAASKQNFHANSDGIHLRHVQQTAGFNSLN